MKMKQRMIRITALFLVVVVLVCTSLPLAAQTTIASDTERAVTVFGIEDGTLKLPCKSAILMEATTGVILYSQNAEEALPPASVTKIMTLLLIMEAVDAGTVRMDSRVTVSANAASMGGSQVYLKEGEQMSLEDLLKSVVISSANDAAVALAEHLCGSVSVFVEKMNAKAKKLGMNSTTFENVTGLDDTAQNHLTSAKDIALMSRELIAHKDILKYSSIWMDSIRDGTFGLTNTNRLVRYYQGCTGLKTGSTEKAGFCVSATAERDGLSLICVIMGAESRDIRNASACQLLDWGFSEYALYTSEGASVPPIKVVGGEKTDCALNYPSFSAVVEKASISSIVTKINLPESINAPVKCGDTVGTIEFKTEKGIVGTAPIIASEDVLKINFFQILYRIAAKFLLI
ncbi:MAG: D-alanyl-D-alanine carboxypeptidase [Ruminococcaceae bacterium]|nr:D-alanyl-D-alanine carboxypeptidase [Oscillospiraceae bacterium]